MVSEDTEITLGVGKLLGLFFILAAICAVFFSIGYSLGKSTAREQALNDQPTNVLAASPPATATTAPAEEKPSAAVTSKPDAPPSTEQAAAATPGSNLTFYKAVQERVRTHSLPQRTAYLPPPQRLPHRRKPQPSSTPSVSKPEG